MYAPTRPMQYECLFSLYEVHFPGETGVAVTKASGANDSSRLLMLAANAE